jgi:uncharacterized protein
MNEDIPKNSHAAFAGDRLIHRGALSDVLAAVKLAAASVDAPAASPSAPALIFESDTGRQVDFDLSGTLGEVLERIQPQRRGRGRPRLGVESREVSLLPRHWEWLEAQPNGASAALRRLVDEARKRDGDPERQRRDACYRVMSALAGDRRGFEEASRALFAGDMAKFQALAAAWPADIREHLDWLLRADAAAT